MKAVTCRRAVAIAVISWSWAVSAQTHPRLLFSATDVAVLRARTTQEPFASMVNLIRREADSAGDWVADYIPDHKAVNAAFMYTLTGDPSWAQKARTQVESIITGSQWAVTSVSGLRLYMHAKSVALTYDMCHAAWDASFRTSVSQALLTHGNTIYTHGGGSQNTNTASNWQGGRFSTAGLCYLATDEAVPAASQDGCWSKVVTYCRDNMGDSPLSRGWNIEGLGYSYFPWGDFVGPYAIAMARSNSQRDLRNQMESVRLTCWTGWAVLSFIMLDGQKLARPDFGDDNPGTTGEGLYGQAFYFCPDNLKPGLKYWYDRTMGALGTGDYDYVREGAIYGYLYYPASVTGQSPLEIDAWRANFVDVGGNGFQTFRNAYANADDMTAQLYVKLRGNRGHNGPDALNFRIIGLSTPWVIGGGRYGGTQIAGQDPYYHLQSSLYPIQPGSGAVSVNGNSGAIVGSPLVSTDGGGHVIASIPTNNVGVQNNKRWFIADYSRESGVEAVYIVADTSTNGRWWQMCTLDSNRITVSANTFTLTGQGPNPSTLKATILFQSDLQVNTGIRSRGSDYFGHQNRYINYQGATGNHLVVMTVAKQGQTHPAARAAGSAVAGAVVDVGGKRYTLGAQDVLYNERSVVTDEARHPGAMGERFSIGGRGNLLRISLAAPVTAGVKLCNAQGRVVAQFPAHFLGAGVHDLKLGSSSPHAGLVFATLSTRSGKTIERVAVRQ